MNPANIFFNFAVMTVLQLLEVQHSRGAVGGSAFAEVLGGARAEEASTSRSAYRRRSRPPLLQPVKVSPVVLGQALDLFSSSMSYCSFH